MHHPTNRITYTTAFVTPLVEHWLEREIAEWVTMKDRSDNPSHHERTLLPRWYRKVREVDREMSVLTLSRPTHCGVGGYGGDHVAEADALLKDSFETKMVKKESYLIRQTLQYI